MCPCLSRFRSKDIVLFRLCAGFAPVRVALRLGECKAASPVCGRRAQTALSVIQARAARPDASTAPAR